MPNDASALIQYELYTGADGEEHRTRLATSSQQWLITAKNNKVYTIKFDKNFTKKHLFTASKKTENVLAEAKRMWDLAGAKDKAAWKQNDGQDAYPPEILAQAQANIDEAKMTRQALHRTTAEQRICATCGHEEKKHKTGSGAQTPCKEGTPPCGCNLYVLKEAYSDKRAAQKKPSANPLAGATTNKTTYLILNKIPIKDFESVVTDAIISQEGGSTPWVSPNQKDIHWDFGASRLGCVITVDTSKPPADWTRHQGVAVGIKCLTVDAMHPVYEVYHMSGVI